MTVPVQTPINRSTGNGVTTVFPYSFKISSEADIEVSVDGVVKTLTTHYTVTGVGNNTGGNVTFVTAPANGTTVVSRRQMDFDRETDYQDQGEMPASTVDDDFDRLVMMVQQVSEETGRSLSFPVGTTGVSSELPTPIAGQLLGWNPAGDAIANYEGLANVPVADAMVPVVQAMTLGEARTSLGAASAGPNSDIISLSGLTTALSKEQGGTGSKTGPVLLGHIYGLWLSTAGSSTTISVSSGEATDSVGSCLIPLAASISKTQNAWASGTGNGGRLGASAVAIYTWYWFFLIYNPTTGAVDVGFDLTLTPTLPSGYTKYRAIFPWKTDASGNWVSGKQTGDYFRLYQPVRDVFTTNPGTSMVTVALANIPTGVKVKALISAMLNNSSDNASAYIHDLDAADEIPPGPLGTINTPGINLSGGNATSRIVGAQLEIMTNTSAQIAYRLYSSGASDIFGIVTYGFTWTRGRE